MVGIIILLVVLGKEVPLSEEGIPMLGRILHYYNTNQIILCSCTTEFTMKLKNKTIQYSAVQYNPMIIVFAIIVHIFYYLGLLNFYHLVTTKYK